MTIRVDIEPAQPCHVLAILGRLRAGDAAEIQAAGLRPGRALWHSYRESGLCKVAFVNGEIAAIWGLGSAMDRIGRPWLMTTAAVEDAPLTFVKQARREVASMLMICPVLVGQVDARYECAIRLLRSLGFSVGRPEPWGSHMFREYRKTRLPWES